MKIEVQLKETSQPIIHRKVENAYTKGDLYCVYEVDKHFGSIVYKYPLVNIWRIIEDYNKGD
jgi:hypothetical protein